MCLVNRLLSHVDTLYNQNQSTSYTSYIICATTPMLMMQKQKQKTKTISVSIGRNETWVDTSNKLEDCLADISAWMSANMFM